MATEQHFAPFRANIVGIDTTFNTPYGEKPLVYADWTASGRLYRPIEEMLLETLGPFVGNTHSEANATGTAMTHAYHEAQKIIKRHVNASSDDVLITAGTGMTACVNKLQRILGLRVPDLLKGKVSIAAEDCPVVFITHMEHSSNHTSWMETIAEVICLDPTEEGAIDLGQLEALLLKYQDRHLKIGAFSACSNVTGIKTPYHAMAKLMHRHGGVCFLDFAASAPYVDIDMHPADPDEKLDAIFFSPHKFLGGPGTQGVLIFDKALYRCSVPDEPGGGTVYSASSWKDYRFYENIEVREDGGTPGFLQAVKTALAIQLKEEMGPMDMQQREEELLERAFAGLRDVPGLRILAEHATDRIGIISFYVEGIHYNLLVKLLNDRFGIQLRGGSSCAGTYGYYLMMAEQRRSNHLSFNPGWVRLSIHPTMTDAELEYILRAIHETVVRIEEWKVDYTQEITTEEFHHNLQPRMIQDMVEGWFGVREHAAAE